MTVVAYIRTRVTRAQSDDVLSEDFDQLLVLSEDSDQLLVQVICEP